MIKIALIYSCISLVCFACFAQNQAPAMPESLSGADSSLPVVTDPTPTVRDNSRITLNWKVLNSRFSDFVTVERSTNDRDFEVVAVLKQTAGSQVYEWVDEAPVKGRNTYRIRFGGSNGVLQYSKPVAVLLAGDTSLRFYPNPVDNILIVRSDAPLDIQIVDATGKQRLNQIRLQGLQTIDVSGIERGVYILRITNRLSGAVVQERLLKN